MAREISEKEREENKEVKARPVQNWSKGKKQEYKDRVTYKVKGKNSARNISGDQSSQGV